MSGPYAGYDNQDSRMSRNTPNSNPNYTIRGNGRGRGARARGRGFINRGGSYNVNRRRSLSPAFHPGHSNDNYGDYYAKSFNYDQPYDHNHTYDSYETYDHSYRNREKGRERDWDRDTTSKHHNTYDYSNPRSNMYSRSGLESSSYGYKDTGPSPLRSAPPSYDYSNSLSGYAANDEGPMSASIPGKTQEETDLIIERISRERPCRTLFVRNISYNAKSEDVRAKFERMGDINVFFDLISTRGMAFITFYDLRAAMVAKDKLNNTIIGKRQVDVHYSLPRESDMITCDRDSHQGALRIIVSHSKTMITNRNVRSRFQEFGDIHNIRPGHVPWERIVEYYDSRAAELAHDTLHSTSFLGGIIRLSWTWDEVRGVPFQEQDKRGSVPHSGDVEHTHHDTSHHSYNQGYSGSKSDYSARNTVPSPVHSRLEQAQKAQQLLSAIAQSSSSQQVDSTEPTRLSTEDKRSMYAHPYGNPKPNRAETEVSLTPITTDSKNAPTTSPSSSLPSAFMALLSGSHSQKNDGALDVGSLLNMLAQNATSASNASASSQHSVSINETGFDPQLQSNMPSYVNSDVPQSHDFAAKNYEKKVAEVDKNESRVMDTSKTANTIRQIPQIEMYRSSAETEGKNLENVSLKSNYPSNNYQENPLFAEGYTGTQQKLAEDSNMGKKAEENVEDRILHEILRASAAKSMMNENSSESSAIEASLIPRTTSLSNEHTNEDRKPYTITKE